MARSETRAQNAKPATERRRLPECPTEVQSSHSEVLPVGKYIFAMKYQNDEKGKDYINNTEILYLATREGVGKDYIRHSQLAAGFPTFCAGEFHVALRAAAPRLTLFNALVEVNNFSGHYKPECKCLRVLLEKLESLGVNTCSTEVRFMGNVKDCSDGM